MSEPTTYRVMLMPDGLILTASQGDNLLDLLRKGGVGIAAACGGDGICGTCRVVVEQGEVAGSDRGMLTDEEYNAGYRLACMSEVIEDIRIRVPERSRRPAEEGHLRGLATSQETLAADGWRFAPPVFKLYVKLNPPTPEDNTADLSRLEKALSDMGISGYRITLPVLQQLSDCLRQGEWAVTLTLFKGPEQLVVTAVDAGDSRNRLYGASFDIGTTGVRGEILDLVEGRVLAQGVEYNGQGVYGADVISRIAYAGKPGGLPTLQQAIVGTMDKLVRGMSARAGIETGELSHIMIAANTTMVHLLTCLTPRNIRLAPYVPSATHIPSVYGTEIGLKTAANTPISMFPAVSSYIGGDIVSGLVGTGIFQRDETVLYIDIGTNGEIVVGNREWMVSASCSAGPAFEGGGIRHGMIATSGAIEKLSINSTDGSITVSTIGGKPAAGICGAGLISTVAALLDAGFIDPRGKFQADESSLIRNTGEGPEFVLVKSDATADNRDIVLTEIDLDNLIRAKAAMFAGYRTLLGSVGLDFNNLDRVVVAGTFGNYLNVEDAIKIGLLPDIKRDRFLFVGNGSLLGARLGSYSTELIAAGRQVSGMVTNIELGDNALFTDNYMAAMFLPHTDDTLFPGRGRQT
ncbi:ferredoxin [Dehalogenimonas lykanthroporepellens BL-DC-9]|nr:ferredoxin [Dehalogenimonas lykanthroporepellens BL-DC-9]